MGAEKADFIKEMWAYGYANALLSGNNAAAFQVAIWGVLQGGIAGGTATPNWGWLVSAPSAVTTGADGLIAWANTHSGPLANVVGLNDIVPVGSDSRGFQAYAISSVPDGGATLMLLGGALIGLGALRRKFRS
jgi:hypothetical protein